MLLFLFCLSNLQAMEIEQKRDERKQALIFVKFLQKLPGDILVTVLRYKIADLTAKGAYCQIPAIKESCWQLLNLLKIDTSKKYWKRVSQTQQDTLQKTVKESLDDLDGRVAKNNSISNLAKLASLLPFSPSDDKKRKQEIEKFCTIFTEKFINPNQYYQSDNETDELKPEYNGNIITQTLMHTAVARDWLMELFLNHAADITMPSSIEKDKNGTVIHSYPLLHCVARRGTRETMEMVLKKNADPNKPNIYNGVFGSYPLHQAISHYWHHEKALPIIELLLEYSASTESKDSYGLTPYQHAQEILREGELVRVTELFSKAKSTI